MSKIVLDFLPIALFFIAFKMFNLKVATMLAIAIAVLHVLLAKLLTGKFQKMSLFTCFIVSILGGATLFFNNEIFIKWKPTMVYWSLATGLLASRLFSAKPAIQLLMGDKLNLPARVWRQLNLMWFGFFGVMGLTNIYVVYNFDTNTWVNFKLFGSLILTLLFVVAQSIYLAQHLETANGSENV